MIKLTRENAQEEIKHHDILIPPAGIRANIYEVTGINVHGPFMTEYPNQPLTSSGHTHVNFDKLEGWHRITWTDFSQLHTIPYMRVARAITMRNTLQGAS